ncbi:MAG: efflux RND transporter periplasmic adaptor subunit [Plectolyngbya sp. WJT66-NPBG17]|jgi:multidrug efflux pump subunit AcrA (membrane-fusion protein)|nr:efflux RND transporter periplasmic adaptor subunit [Plectolyngbya sp. WJT66-NPBG17]MBW4524226.1 efflux RND transporter periplasmic adaptor subunit [Phormidium tanganyikae FI6-MK23]
MHRQQINFTYTLFPFLVTVSLLSACRPTEPKANASQAKGVPVKIENVKSSIVDNTEEFNASLESRQSVTLKPRIEGQISRIFVRAGDAVKEGTLILQIDPRQQAANTQGSQASADSALAGVASARSGVASARATMENAKATLKAFEADRVARDADVKFNRQQYDRFAKLYRAGAASKQLLEQYENGLRAARANLTAVDARIQAQKAEIDSKNADITARQADVSRAQRGYQQAQATTEGQQVELQYFRITAPFTGTVGDLPVKEGDFVNTSSPLATLTQNNSLEVNIAISTEKVKRMQAGTRVDLINAQGQQVGSSRVFMISPKVNSETQTVQVKALVDNAAGGLRAEQQIRARVVWERSPSLLIPTTAISRIAGQDFVYVAEQSEAGLVAKQKPVKLGVIRGNDQQVIEGLTASDKIVVTGLGKITDGAPIMNEVELGAPTPEKKM